jgi:hypothetical protein
MQRTITGIMAILALALLYGNHAQAEDFRFASHSQLASIMEQQNRRINELEAALNSQGGGCEQGCCDTGCDSCCCDPCCRPAGVIAGAELTFLKPHHSRGIGGPLSAFDLEFDYETAPRFWVGWQGSDGLGFRVRYWEFDHSTSDTDVTVQPPTNHFAHYEVYVLDAEVVDSMSLGCYWDASVFAGFRYVDFSEERFFTDVTGTLDTGNAFGNGSIGLTLGGELRRCIGNGLAAFVNTRASVMMGDEKEFAVDAGNWVLIDEEFDNIYYIWEGQAGGQWTRELQMGGYLFARAAAEVQIWDNFSGEPFFDGGESWGLGGFAVSAGIIR